MASCLPGGGGGFSKDGGGQSEDNNECLGQVFSGALKALSTNRVLSGANSSAPRLGVFGIKQRGWRKQSALMDNNHGHQ
jgi:hypothetical protein